MTFLAWKKNFFCGICSLITYNAYLFTGTLGELLHDSTRQLSLSNSWAISSNYKEPRNNSFKENFMLISHYYSTSETIASSYFRSGCEYLGLIFVRICNCERSGIIKSSLYYEFFDCAGALFNFIEHTPPSIEITERDKLFFQALLHTFKLASNSSSFEKKIETQSSPQAITLCKQSYLQNPLRVVSGLEPLLIGAAVSLIGNLIGPIVTLSLIGIAWHTLKKTIEKPQKAHLKAKKNFNKEQIKALKRWMKKTLEEERKEQKNLSLALKENKEVFLSITKQQEMALGSIRKLRSLGERIIILFSAFKRVEHETMELMSTLEETVQEPHDEGVL